MLEYDNLALSPDFPALSLRRWRSASAAKQPTYRDAPAASTRWWTRHDHAEARRIGNILGFATGADRLLEGLPCRAGRVVRKPQSGRGCAPAAPPANCRVVTDGALGRIFVDGARLSPRTGTTAVGATESELSDLEAELSPPEATQSGERHCLPGERPCGWSCTTGTARTSTPFGATRGQSERDRGGFRRSADAAPRS